MSRTDERTDRDERTEREKEKEKLGLLEFLLYVLFCSYFF